MKVAHLQRLERDELEQLCAYYEDVLGVHENLERAEALRTAFGLSPAAAWLLSRLAAGDGRIFRRDALIDFLPSKDAGATRGEKLLDVYMVHLRKALGADAFETVWGVGFRLTPLGRLRVRHALDQEKAA